MNDRDKVLEKIVSELLPCRLLFHCCTRLALPFVEKRGRVRRKAAESMRLILSNTGVQY